MKTLEGLQVAEVAFIPVKPRDGLVGFASCIVNQSFYLGSIGVHTRPGGGIRLVYPRIHGLNAFHPIKREVGRLLENAVQEKYEELHL